MIRLTFLLRSLWSGGAERQFLELVKRLDRGTFHITVLLFYPQGDLFAELNALEDVTIASLEKRSRWDLLGFTRGLVEQIRAQKTDVLYSFLDVPNVFAAVAGKMAGVKVVWGVRSSHMDFSRYDWTAGVVYRVECFLSRFADCIVVNSQSGADYHRRKGFRGTRMRVIPNGVDTSRFQPNAAWGASVRREWKIPLDVVLVGLVARLDPMKDHPTFLRAAAQVHRECPQARFVCVGDGPAAYRDELQSLAASLGLGDVLVWAGQRADMPAVYNALDVLVSSSYGEGFPNVIGEAMACGVPCVVTDAGDSARIVGETGIVAPPRQPAALADALMTMLAMSPEERRALGKRARERIATRFSVERMVKATETLLRELATVR
ncbi:MAG: glycosyltransferase [Anaerolineae bacterium]|nr:MAG: glycosyltransferase [Anaerolineae bacterium]